jgi:hypothetical protein
LEEEGKSKLWDSEEEEEHEEEHDEEEQQEEKGLEDGDESTQHEIIFGGTGPRTCFDCERTFPFPEHNSRARMCTCRCEYTCTGCNVFDIVQRGMKEAAFRCELEEGSQDDRGLCLWCRRGCCD